jgi:iron(III) transport system substrate-binding protein
MRVSGGRSTWRHTGRGRLASVCVALAALLAACGTGSGGSGSKASTSSPPPTLVSPGPGAYPGQKLIDAANAEGNVVLYAATAPADNDKFIKAFNAVYPHIKVTVNRAASTALDPQIEAEIRTHSATADVYLSSDRKWLLDNQDLLMPLETPRAAKNFNPWLSGNGRIVGFQFHPGGLEWNTSKLPHGLSSFQDLANLPHDATIGVVDPKLSTGALAWGYDAVKALGQNWLKAVLSHQVRFYPESTSLVQAVASGEVEAGIPAFLSVARDAQRSGAPVGSAVGNPSITSLLTAAILKAGAHPNAAQLMVDFLLSPAGQQAMAQDKLSPLPNVPGTLGVVKNGQTIVADISTITPDQQAAYLKEFDQDAGRG